MNELSVPFDVECSSSEELLECSSSSTKVLALALLVVEVAAGVLFQAVLSPAVTPLVDTRCSARCLISMGQQPVVTRFASWSLRRSTSVGNKKGVVTGLL